jgi:hypothetical protein
MIQRMFGRSSSAAKPGVEERAAEMIVARKAETQWICRDVRNMKGMVKRDAFTVETR